METPLFTYDDTTVMSTDVELLDPPHFLNDRVISFYFEYVQYITIILNITLIARI